MSTLIIKQGSQTHTVDFDPPQKLYDLLRQAGVQAMHPCGGRGVCGKCAVMLEGLVSAPNDAELRCGVRLSCQAVILGDATVILPQSTAMQIESGSGHDLAPVQPMPGRIGAAIDIGTTTLALQLYSLSDGRCLGGANMLNPQTSVAADVIGRMDAALKGNGEALRKCVEDAVSTMLHSACAQANVNPGHVDALVVTGNTTMLYLLTGRSPEPLSHAPFVADHLFGETGELLGRACYYPPCLHAFVGADTACALLAGGMLERSETSLLCDIGTNGEIALWQQGRLSVSSTAAGPAFEGAGISCGCGSIPGAIDRITVANGRLYPHTIGEKTPVGLCGSGLVDAVAALLATGFMDETGMMDDDEYPLADNIVITQKDIRAVQLAKAAMAAGVASLLHEAGCTEREVTCTCVAGGFGSHLHIGNASAIGLLPAGLAERVKVIGNAALDGAAMLLMDTGLRLKLDSLASVTKHVRLDGNAFFSQRYIDEMFFPEAE